MNHLNINLCHSIKNKNEPYLQCCNKPKNNELLCGVHIKSKNIMFYQNTFINNNEIEFKQDNGEYQLAIDKEIYSPNDLFEKILNNVDLNVYSIRSSIKNSYLNKLINTK